MVMCGADYGQTKQSIRSLLARAVGDSFRMNFSFIVVYGLVLPLDGLFC